MIFDTIMVTLLILFALTIWGIWLYSYFVIPMKEQKKWDEQKRLEERK